ncbi:hypothetical protein SAMN02910358_02229 [Lachnospiraceae bacterium XBB1006]|nr:hypothetical protein SAMN02910358_02229 [Lachnospiraceae bacterium XBB1006]
MKKVFKNIIAISLVCGLTLNGSFASNAATGTVTKENDAVKVSFKYTSYKNADGQKKVKNGSIQRISCTSPLEFSEESRSISIIDGGRTYLVKLKGFTYHNRPFGSTINPTKTRRYEFGYRTSY